MSKNEEKNINQEVAYHDKVIELLIKQQESASNEKRINRFNALVISFGTLALSLGFGVYQFTKGQALQRKFQYEQSVQSQIKQQIDSLDKQIQIKISELKTVNKVIADARSHVEIGHIYCENGKFLGNASSYEGKLLQNGYNLISAINSIKYIFDHSTLKKVTYFLSLLDQNRYPCQKNKELDKELDAKLYLAHHEVDKLINSSIDTDQIKKEKLIGKLANSPPWKE